MRAASPVTYIAPDDPPFLLMYSTDDEIIYPQQTQEMSWDLTANGVAHQLVSVDGGGHEFDNAGEQPDEAGIARAIVQFFVRTLVYHQPIAANPSDGGAASSTTTTEAPAPVATSSAHHAAHH